MKNGHDWQKMTYIDKQKSTSDKCKCKITDNKIPIYDI